MVEAVVSKAEVNGVNLAYQVAGTTGPEVVFLHGMSIGSPVWTHQVQYLADICRVVTYDARGVGESDSLESGYDVPTLAADLVGLMDHLEIRRAVVCGLSHGGRVALYAALEYPQRVRALVLCDTTCGAAGDQEKKRLQELIEEVSSKGLEAAVDLTLSTTPWIQPFLTHFTEHGFVGDKSPRAWASINAPNV